MTCRINLYNNKNTKSHFVEKLRWQLLKPSRWYKRKDYLRPHNLSNKEFHNHNTTRNFDVFVLYKTKQVILCSAQTFQSVASAVLLSVVFHK